MQIQWRFDFKFVLRLPVIISRYQHASTFSLRSRGGLSLNSTSPEYVLLLLSTLCLCLKDVRVLLSVAGTQTFNYTNFYDTSLDYVGRNALLPQSSRLFDIE